MLVFVFVVIVGEVVVVFFIWKMVKKQCLVYKKFLNFGLRGGKMEEMLNKVVMEGIFIVKYDFVCYVKDFCKNCLF